MPTVSDARPDPIPQGAVWALPFRGRKGFGIFVSGALIGSAAAAIEALDLPIAPTVLRSLLTIYLIVVAYQTVRDVSRGKRRVACWPGLPNHEAFFIPVARIAGATLWLLAPVLGIRLIGDVNLAFLFWPLLAIGGYLVPMVVVRVATRESFLGGQPFAVLISIFRTWKPYTLSSVPFFLAALAMGVAFTAESRIGAIASPFAAYLFLASFAGLGRFHMLYGHRLSMRIATGHVAEEPPEESNA